MLTWDEDLSADLLRRAYEVATKSPDPSSQVGVMVCHPNGDVIEIGWNDFTPGVEITPERLERPLKYELIEHAERSVIFSMVKNGLFMPEDAVMVGPWTACTDCARCIVMSGVRTLLRHADIMKRSPERWLESLKLADEILLAGGVEIVEYEGHLDAPAVLNNGEIWTP